ncbi:glycerol acyltransferase [Chloroflexus islandicus]|uniref:Glycerol acyltransferase n=1 Tax=Chloroflexus islandicus TaxID=1707952 RepID=A0A178M9P0_9CHLR|nr:lysophospholipid acyltransferase family protein [Chloroflexus islandicus]OAN45246.1 glycerol acyltransferase [Chloroflexus islandicus]
MNDEPVTPPTSDPGEPRRPRRGRARAVAVEMEVEPPPTGAPNHHAAPTDPVEPPPTGAPNDHTAPADPVDPPPVATALEWDESPPTRRSAEQLFEVEIDIRQQSEQQPGPQAALGNFAAGVVRLIGENLQRMTNEQVERVNSMLQGVDLRDYLDPDFWKGIGMVLRYQIDEQINFIQRRQRGEYTTDPFGMDREIIEVARPFLSFMYHTWWRVQASGLEHVPAEGRALLVANHSGVLPWDGAMIATAVVNDHPAQNERIVRSLHLHWFTTLPVIAPTLAALGQVPGIPENAIRLLERDELVCVFPEGLKGVGKLFKDRYKLARFGRGGFVQAALRTQAPIVPVAVVGAEEIYPMFANAEGIAKLLGFPYFPLTPFFPWFGLLGVIPLPTRWSITFCPPIDTTRYGPDAADDPITVLELSEQVRETIQETINQKLAERTSVF